VVNPEGFLIFRGIFNFGGALGVYDYISTAEGALVSGINQDSGFSGLKFEIVVVVVRYYHRQSIKEF